jgi:2',3'-cyclic-nucleotide 2'-phosphodiesterase (5'-nucleotidase family)
MKSTNFNARLLRYSILLFIPIAFHFAVHAESRESEQDTLTITILSTTDVHGWILPWDYYTDRPDERYGLSKAATLIDSIRAGQPHTLLLDAGDWLQGNPLAEFFARVDTLDRHFPFLQIVDHLGYDAIVVGNHEFNFGVNYLDRQVAKTNTPVLGANVYYHSTDDPAYVPYIIKEIGGVSIGIFGLTTPGSAVWDRPRVEGVLDFADGVETAERIVNRLVANGADIIIALAHSGLDGESSYSVIEGAEENFGRSLAENVPAIDYIVLGHAHRVLDDLTLRGPDGRSVGVVMPGRWASHLGVSEMLLVRDGTSWKMADHHTTAIPVRHAASHPEVERMVYEVHEEVRNYINAPLTQTPDMWDATRARMEDTPIVDLIQHIQMKATGAQLSAAAAFNTNAQFGPGPISLGQITRIYPYENSLYTLEVTGKQVREYLEYTSQYYLQCEADDVPAINPDWPGYNFDLLAGIEYTLDLRNVIGSRVVHLEYEGTPVRDEDIFTIAVNSYRAEGGGGFAMLAESRVLNIIDTPVRDLIAEFLRERESIRHEDVFEMNWKLRPQFPK